MRIAYADPAYLGRHSLYPENTPTDHRELLDAITKADGWGLSCSSSSLAELLTIVVDVVGPNIPRHKCTHRVLAWCRPDAAPTTDLGYSWEPVIMSPARPPSGYTRDWVEASHKRSRRGLVGAKPPEFYQWFLRCVGWRDGDTLVEVFPGTSLLSDMVEQRHLWGAA